MKKDVWAAGDLYEPYVGRWSRVVARDFLSWLAVPRDREWLDVGCGTGALSQLILAQCEPRRVRGIDSSPGFVDYARGHCNDPRVSFDVGDAQSLQVPDGSFDAAVSGLVLNFVPQPERAAAEMRRAVRAGGIVAAYVWDYAGKMELMRYFWDAAVELNPAAKSADEGVRFPLCRPENLEKLFVEARLHRVQVRAIDAPTVFRDFEDYWTPFLGGQAPAPGYCMSLSEDARAALRERIRARLPIGADGSIALIARAWAVKGTAG
ncbi:MAG TPA: class I SAM-dependent methyltransferase [Burkholderiales bacterium]|nr:class I SAM-dependent methyltransferase [Burkholderiales bacterium]